jgi:adenosylhomocysteine nucleosidase
MSNVTNVGSDRVTIAVVVSAGGEWRPVRAAFSGCCVEESPFGEWFYATLPVAGEDRRVLFLHGGWGKIAAAASTQYVIDRWAPRLVVNLGTCGGFAGEIERGAVILVERTVVYDIIEQMGDQAEHIAHYTTDLDLGWLAEPYPQPVRRTLLVSADRDLLATEIPRLKRDYGAVAGDWESGAIAWVVARNNTRCLILRGVSDLVGSSGGEAYGNIQVFAASTQEIMGRLVHHLPQWIARA